MVTWDADHELVGLFVFKQGKIWRCSHTDLEIVGERKRLARMDEGWGDGPEEAAGTAVEERKAVMGWTWGLGGSRVCACVPAFHSPCPSAIWIPATYVRPQSCCPVFSLLVTLRLPRPEMILAGAAAHHLPLLRPLSVLCSCCLEPPFPSLFYSLVPVPGC